jgi:hypothetical protein
MNHKTDFFADFAKNVYGIDIEPDPMDLDKARREDEYVDED